MKRALLFLGVLLASTLAALALRRDNGYVLISYGNWTVETSLLVFVVAVALIVGALWALVRFLRGLYSAPRRFGGWRAARRTRQAREALTRGLIETSEGHWKRAEKTLLTGVEYAEMPLANYLAAARTAHVVGADDRRDDYLRQAREAAPEARVAVEITRAELQMDHNQHQQAVATLDGVREQAPDNLHVLVLLSRCYRALGDWSNLRRMLPKLRKQKALPAGELESLSVETFRELMRSAVERRRTEELESLMREVPRELGQRPELLRVYAEGLGRLGQADQAAGIVERALKRDYDDGLAAVYGQLEASDPERRMKCVRDWLKRYGERPALLLTAGRLCIHRQVWGRARSYLERSIELEPRPETYRELARLLRRLDEPEKARSALETGLDLAVGQGPDTAEASAAAPSLVPAEGHRRLA